MGLDRSPPPLAVIRYILYMSHTQGVRRIMYILYMQHIIYILYNIYMMRCVYQIYMMQRTPYVWDMSLNTHLLHMPWYGVACVKYT